MQLFISYSREDFTTEDRLHNDLRDAGRDIWIDKVGLPRYAKTGAGRYRRTH